MPVLARVVREVENDVRRGRISQSTRAKFQAVAMLTREERAKVKSDKDVSESFRTEQLRRLDGIATILSREDLPDMARFELNTTRELARFIAPKGSITLDGVSLTVNTVRDTAFSVLIIPHTLNVTTLSSWHAGSEVNIEVDLMARYAARLTEMK